MKNLLTTTALVLSLAVSGAAYANDDTGAKSWDKPPHEMQKALSQLPKEKASLFHQSMKETKEKNSALYAKMRTLHDERTAIEVAPKFDKDAYLAKSKEIRDTQSQMKANMAASFASVLAQLTPEERKIVSAAEPQHFHHGHKNGKGQDAAPPVEDQ